MERTKSDEPLNIYGEKRSLFDDPDFVGNSGISEKLEPKRIQDSLNKGSMGDFVIQERGESFGKL